MNILLIDDHFCAREGVASLLKQMFAQLQVYEAENVEQGLAVAHRTSLNMVLLDIQLPGKNGLLGLKAFRGEFPDLCVVMYSGLDDRELVFDALREGSMGFITKNLSRTAFVEALRDVISGKVYLPASVVGPPTVSIPKGTNGGGIRPVSDPAVLGLTPREFEVLAGAVLGKSNKAIAHQLNISEQTVKNHNRSIFLKLGVARRTELLVKMYEKGVVFGKPEIGNQEF